MESLEIQNITNDNIKNINELNLSPIQKFYSDAHIFITGSTGLLGSSLLEKLLRSCPNISTVFLLLRNKKGRNMETRLDEMFDSVVFDTLKKECPKFRCKLVAIEGDCALPELGLSLQDKKLLIDEVNIIFHLAATVRFDQKLKTAVAINVRAPRDLLRFAHQMPKLKSLVHVSTLYSNCIQDVIDEKIYPASIDYQKLILLTENLPENILEDVTPQFIGKYPNTYTYTKQIAETIIKAESRDLPVGISRPSIVISTYKEPIPGWINNVYNVTGITAASGMGVLRVLYTKPNRNVDIVPADMYINSLIATAWDIGSTFEASKRENLHYEIPIYNYESTSEKPINYKTLVDLTTKHGRKYPPAKSIWYPFLYVTGSYLSYLVSVFFMHTVPAIITDGVLLCMRKPPKMMKIYTKLDKFFMLLEYFSKKSWTCKNQNVQKLRDKLSEKDKKIFFSDIRKLDWDTYFQTYFCGIRVYVLKDPLETVPEALRRHKWLHFVHQIVQVAAGISLIWILWFLFALIQDLIF